MLIEIFAKRLDELALPHHRGNITAATRTSITPSRLMPLRDTGPGQGGHKTPLPPRSEILKMTFSPSPKCRNFFEPPEIRQAIGRMGGISKFGRVCFDIFLALAACRREATGASFQSQAARVVASVYPTIALRDCGFA